MHDYYAAQSQITDPGQYRELFDGLPDDLEGLCRVVQGLHMHLEEGAMYGIAIPPERLPECDLRTVPALLGRILELDDSPLTVARSPERRVVGCCRDFALMLCAMLRHKGVPARVRFGFSLYFRHDFACDHVITEYWRGDEGRWALADPQQDEAHREMNRLTFDPYDMPRDRFLLAGRAWDLVRGGIIDEKHIGYSDSDSGLWVVRSYLVHDLAALVGRELNISDSWGLSKHGPDYEAPAEELAMLDEIARLTTSDYATVAELEAAYGRDGLCVTPTLSRYLIGRGWGEEEVDIR